MLNQRLAPLHIAGFGYDEFIAALTPIAYAACEHGARHMEAAGRSLEKIHDDEETRREFIAACHEGFGQAQSAIGAQVIDLEGMLRTAREELSAARRSRDKDRIRD